MVIPALADCWLCEEVTVVAVLRDTIEDDGMIGDDNDFSEDTPLGDLIARSCNSWIL